MSKTAGSQGLKDNCGKKSHLCIFEYIYFARPDSIIDGQSVHDSRMLSGAYLAEEYPIKADVVIGVPDSGLVAAKGYALASGIPYNDGFVKNRYVARSFIKAYTSQPRNGGQAQAQST